MAANGYKTVNVIKKRESIVVTAGSTVDLTGPVKVSGGDSRHLVAQVDISSVTSSIIVKMQDSFDGGDTWVDTPTATSTKTEAGKQLLVHNINQADSTRSLGSLVRVVAVAGSGEGATIDAVWLTRLL